MKKSFCVFSKYKLLSQSEQGCLYYHSGWLYFASQISEAPQRVCRLTHGFKQCIIASNRWLERALRIEPRFAYPKDSGYIISWNCSMYFLDLHQKKLEKLFDFREGMHNPLSMTGMPGSANGEESYVYGDYWANPKYEAVGIYRVENTVVRSLYSFKPGQILHIHGITYDKNSGRVLVCTGDSDVESGIWETRDDFCSLQPIVTGKQKYRSCAAYMVEDGLLYATDTPLTDNAIYLYSEEEKKERLIYKLNGPCIYSAKLRKRDGSDLFVFATSVEPDSTLPSWRYKFTYRLGKGVKNRKVTIVAGNIQIGFSQYVELSKDFLPMLAFQFGNANFPHQEDDGSIYFTPIAVRKYDGKTLKITID